MVRRKRAKSRAFATMRSSGVRAKRNPRRHGGNLNVMTAAIYGAGRPLVAAWVAPITASVPVLNMFGTSGAMFAAGWATNRFGPAVLKPYGRAAMIVEGANLGAMLGSMVLGGASANSGNGKLF